MQLANIPNPSYSLLHYIDREIFANSWTHHHLYQTPSYNIFVGISAAVSEKKKPTHLIES
jgi:hypothetical protein